MASKTLKTRLSLGFGAQAFSQIVNILIRLVELPLLLSFWGPQLYGEWLILAAIPAYLSFGDGGFSEAALREMTMRNSKGDRDGSLAVFQSTWVFLLFISIILGIFVYIFAQMVPLSDLFNFSVMNDDEIKRVIILLTAQIIFVFQAGLLNGGFWVTGDYPAGMFFQALSQLLEFGCLATAVFLGGGPVQAAFSFLAGRVLGTFLMLLGQRRVSPWLQYGVSKITLDEIRQLATPAFASIAFPLGNAMNIQGMRMVIGLILSPVAVAIFSSLRTLSRFAIQPSLVVKHIMLPEMATAYGANNIVLFKRLYKQSSQYATWLSIISCGFILLTGNFIINRLAVGAIVMDWSVYVPLVLTALVAGIWHTGITVFTSSNRHEKIALTYFFVYGLSSLFGGYVLGKFFGLSGVGFSLFLAECFFAVYLLKKSIEDLGEKPMIWLKWIVDTRIIPELYLSMKQIAYKNTK